MVEVHLDGRGLKRAIKRKPQILRREFNHALAQYGRHLHFTMVKTRLTGRPGLRARSNRLRGSFHWQVDKKALSMRYGTNVKYARIHEFGGTVTPKKRKWLTIPMDANLTPAGVMRWSAPQLSGVFKIVRFVEIAPHRKALLLAGQSEEDLEPMFTLVKRVTIKPRLGLRSTFKKSRPELYRLINRAIRRTNATKA